MTSTPVQAVLDRLPDAKPQSNGQWIATCTAHPDRDPSLSIGTGDDGRALVKCQAGCATEDVIAAMVPPLTMADLFPKGTSPNGSATKRKPTTPVDFRTSQRKIVAEYDYVDDDGVLLFQVVRYSDKSFRQRRPDNDGGWVWNIKGVERVLYQLPGVTCAPDHCTIYPCEGEKDADRLIAEGLIATCNSGGAGKAGLTDLTPLHGCHIAIIPDNDQIGRDHAQDFATQLHGKAASIRIIEPPGLAEHGDVSDWLDIPGNDVEALDELAAQAPEWTPEMCAMVHKSEAETALTTVEPYRNNDESMAAIRRMAGTSRQLRETSSTLAEQVAEWLDRRGVETLTSIEYPVSYAAKAIGVERSNFLRLGRIGRVRRVCRALHTPVTLSDRAIVPLTRLLRDHPEAIPEAIESATELVKAEAVREERTKPKPINTRHTATVVDELIGPVPKHVPVTRKPSPDADAMAVEGVRRQIEELADAAAIIGDGIPPDVRTIIKALARHRWSLK